MLRCCLSSGRFVFRFCIKVSLKAGFPECKITKKRPPQAILSDFLPRGGYVKLQLKSQEFVFSTGVAGSSEHSTTSRLLTISAFRVSSSLTIPFVSI